MSNIYLTLSLPVSDSILPVHGAAHTTSVSPTLHQDGKGLIVQNVLMEMACGQNHLTLKVQKCEM